MIGIEPTSPEPDAADLAAFERLYDEHLPMVYRFTTARLGRAEGEDAAADVFHAAAVAWSDGRGDVVTPAWLMAVARNKVVDRWRRAERRAAKSHLVAVPSDAVADVPWEVREPGVRDAVLRTLDRLKVDHRALLVLHYVDGMSVPEIAKSLERSVSAVESSLARARKAFKRQFEREGAR